MNENLDMIANTQEYMLQKLSISKAHLLCCHVLRGIPGTELTRTAVNYGMVFSSEREPYELIDSPILPRSDMLVALRRTGVIFRLINLGFGFKKGEFGVVHLNPVKEQPSVFKSKSSQFKSRSSKNPSLKSIKSRSSKNPSYKSISSRFKSVAIPSLKSKSSRIRLKSRSSQFKSVAIPSLKSLSSKNPSLKSIKSKSKSLSKNKKPKKTRKARAKKIKGGSSLNPSSYPFGDFDDLKGLGSFTQQEMLAAPNNTPNDLALLK